MVNNIEKKICINVNKLTSNQRKYSKLKNKKFCMLKNLRLKSLEHSIDYLKYEITSLVKYLDAVS